MIRLSKPPSPKGVAAVVGVGPCLGLAIARKFASEGLIIAILAPDLEKLSRYADEVATETKGQVFAISIDCSDNLSIRKAFESVLSLGPLEVLVYNTCHDVGTPVLSIDISVESFRTALTVSGVGAFYCAQQVIPKMVERGRGTILFTGTSASIAGEAGHCTLCCGKFAVRALSQCLAKELQSSGIHVVHIIIDGLICISGSSTSSSTGQQQQPSSPENCYYQCLRPDVVAETYWYMHVQDRRAWTHEIDLRPPAAEEHVSVSSLDASTSACAISKCG